MAKTIQHCCRENPHISPRIQRSEAAHSDFPLCSPPPPPAPENAGVTQQFRPFVVFREGKGEVANSDFVPFIGDR